MFRTPYSLTWGNITSKLIFLNVIIIFFIKMKTKNKMPGDIHPINVPVKFGETKNIMLSKHILRGKMTGSAIAMCHCRGL